MNVGTRNQKVEGGVSVTCKTSNCLFISGQTRCYSGKPSFYCVALSFFWYCLLLFNVVEFVWLLQELGTNTISITSYIDGLVFSFYCYSPFSCFQTYIAIQILLQNSLCQDPQVVTGSHDSTIKFWDLRHAGKTMTTLTHHKKSVRAMALHPKECVANFCSLT